MAISIKLDKEKREEIRRLLARRKELIEKMDTPLSKISLILLRSVDRNFIEQGRPTKWAKLSPMALAMRRTGRAPGSPKILMDTGRLRASITPFWNESEAGVGTNVSYAKLHQFGGKVKLPTRGKKTYMKDVPARPFLLIQDDDKKKIHLVLRRWLNDEGITGAET